MVKMMLLLRRRPGMTREEFMAYYEERHAPLALEILPGIVEYRRNFVNPNAMFSAGHIHGEKNAPPPDFDVVTEIWFNSLEDYQKVSAATRDPTVGQRLAADERNLFDTRPEAMVFFLVDERISPKTGAHPS